MVDIIDNQYVADIIDYILNNTINQKIINIFIPISIKTQYHQMGYLRYKNIFYKPKVTNGIDVKCFIPG